MVRQKPGIGVAPGLDMDAGDRRDVLGAGGADANHDPSPGVRSRTATKKPSVPCRAGVRRRDRKSTRLNSSTNAQLVCRLLLEKKKNQMINTTERYISRYIQSTNTQHTRN